MFNFSLTYDNSNRELIEHFRKLKCFSARKKQPHSTPVCTRWAQFCKPISRHPRDVICCREQEAALIFTQELNLHFSGQSLVVQRITITVVQIMTKA